MNGSFYGLEGSTSDKMCQPKRSMQHLRLMFLPELRFEKGHFAIRNVLMQYEYGKT